MSSMLGRLGIRLVRVPREPVDDPPPDAPPQAAGNEPRPAPVDFYQPSPTCQIARLGFLYELFLGRREQGFFVEVGAYDGFSYSNTSCLADRGWSGLLVEPVPAYAALARERYAARRDVEVVEVAIGAHDGEVSIHVAGPLTTASSSLLAEYRQTEWPLAKRWASTDSAITVQQSTLDHLLESREIDAPLDLLVVDVEGSERAVFDGFTVDRWQPKMMIVELVDTHPDLVTTRASDARLGREIQAAGYRIVYKDLINTVFVEDALARSTLEGPTGGEA